MEDHLAAELQHQERGVPHANLPLPGKVDASSNLEKRCGRAGNYSGFEQHRISPGVGCFPMPLDGQRYVRSTEEISPGGWPGAETSGQGSVEENSGPGAGRSAWLQREILPHEPSVRQWLARKLGCTIAVDDVIQDIFLRLSQTASVSHIDSPRHYLWSTAISVLRDRARRSSVAPQSTLDTDELSELPCDSPSPFQQVSGQRDLELVLELMHQLPPRSRRVLILRRLEGLSMEDTASELGISVSAVEKHQRRAHVFLKEQLARLG